MRIFKVTEVGKWCQKSSDLNYSSTIRLLMPFESHLSNKRMTVKRLVFHSFGHHTKAHDVSSSPWDIGWDGAKVVPLEVRGQQLWTSEDDLDKKTCLNAAEKSHIHNFLLCPKTWFHPLCLLSPALFNLSQFMSGNVFGITWFTLIAAGAKCTINYVAALR